MSAGVKEHHGAPPRIATMELLTFEVDGSLANPYAAGAVAIWTAVVSIIAVLVARHGGTAKRRIAGIAVFGALLSMTWPAQLLIGNILYWLTDLHVKSVGFWGGPPIWIAPAVSCGIGGLVWLRSRHHTGQPPQS